MSTKKKNIQQLLADKGFSQSSIARMLGVKPPSVHNVISGRRSTPRIRTAISLAIGKPVSEIWPDAKPTREDAA